MEKRDWAHLAFVNGENRARIVDNTPPATEYYIQAEIFEKRPYLQEFVNKLENFMINREITRTFLKVHYTFEASGR